MNIVINPDYSKLSLFIEQLPSDFSNGGDMIYEARNQIKKFRVQDIDVVVKRYKVPICINRIIYAFFRPSKAKRAYDYAMFLLSKGIRTPEPIAYIEVKKGLFFYQGYFISKMENLKNETVENTMMFDFEDAFVVRATNPENNDFIITIGNRFATPKHYETQEEAQEAIKNRDWNLIATLTIELAEQAVKNHMSNNKKNKK